MRRRRRPGERRGYWYKILIPILLLVLAAALGVVTYFSRTGKKPEQESTTLSGEATTEETTTEETTQETAIAETEGEETTKEEETEPYPLIGEEPFTFYDTGEKRIAYLTFDDGPSDNTYPILDILDTYGIKATFFTIGKEDEVSAERYREIVKRGHSLAMHSYSHKYNELYASMESFQADTQRIHDLLYQVTGEDVRLYRFPGGSSNSVTKVDVSQLIEYMNANGYIYYDWNVSSGDATGDEISAEQIVSNVLEQSQGCTRAMILMHDTNAKGETVKALPQMIQGLMDAGFEIEPITNHTKPVQHRKASYMQ